MGSVSLACVRRLLTIGCAAVACLVAQTTVAAAVGDYCEGSEVPRCVWISNSDAGPQPRASIRDASGGGDYNVAVNQLHYQYWDGNSWE